jgi:hypothetical protein
MKRNERSGQLELELPRPALRITVRRRGSTRAEWWFEQMRKAVDSAVDWKVAGEDPSDPISSLANRRLSFEA